MNHLENLNGGQNSDDESRIDEAALDWLIRHDGGLTAAEQDEFFEWLAADARHGEWLARHRRTYQQFDSMVQWRPEHTDEPNPDLLATPWAMQRWWVGLSAMAAAAVVAFAVFGWTADEENLDFKGFLPETGAMALEYQIHRLPDGSIVELNQGTQVALHYSGEQRRVDLLSGEAYFKVAKNPDRPFIVSARGIDVKAVGTAFNVKLGGDSLEVMVTHGRVLMDSSALVSIAEEKDNTELPEFAPELSAGQRSHISFITAEILPKVADFTEEDVVEELAWKHQVLEFVDRPLGEIVQEFNHYNTRQIFIADPELLKTEITATFRSYNLDGFVRLLELTCPVKASFESDESIIITLVP